MTYDYILWKTRCGDPPSGYNKAAQASMWRPHKFSLYLDEVMKERFLAKVMALFDVIIDSGDDMKVVGYFWDDCLFVVPEIVLYNYAEPSYF